MAKKRKGVSSDEDDDWFEPVKSARTAKKRVAVKIKRKRAASGDESAEPDDEYEAQTSDAVQTRRHPISMHTLSEVKPLRAALLGWYAGVHASRGMPWRKPYEHTSNPEERSQRAYEVWISEIMLQQTQVATVIPYYNKWMAKFPTIRDLAASDIETVNSLWKGLGYYSRAARLLSGAQKVIQQLGGRLPDNAKDLESKIPGIGRYSAGAICSIAYNQCVPVLDGNVHRLLSRVLALYAPPKAKQTLDILWAGASAFVDRAERPGDLNQALIELGSTVCKVRDPDCDACPLRPWCAGHHYESYTKQDAHSSATYTDKALPDIEDLCTLCEPLPAPGLVTAFPMKAEKKKAREELDIVNVIEWRNNVYDRRWFLLVRRPEGGLLAGLHEFPTAPNVPMTTSAPAQIEIAHTLLTALLAAPPSPAVSACTEPSEPPASGSSRSAAALRITKVVPAGDVLHIFSHIRKTYRAQWVVLEGGGPEPPPLRTDSASAGLAHTGGTVAKKAHVRPVRKRRIEAGQAAFTAENQDAQGSRAIGQSTLPHAAWMPLDAVADANIGTGVLKVWKQVGTLWATNDTLRTSTRGGRATQLEADSDADELGAGE